MDNVLDSQDKPLILRMGLRMDMMMDLMMDLMMDSMMAFLVDLKMDWMIRMDMKRALLLWEYAK